MRQTSPFRKCLSFSLAMLRLSIASCTLPSNNRTLVSSSSPIKSLLWNTLSTVCPTRWSFWGNTGLKTHMRDASQSRISLSKTLMLIVYRTLIRLSILSQVKKRKRLSSNKTLSNSSSWDHLRFKKNLSLSLSNPNCNNLTTTNIVNSILSNNSPTNNFSNSSKYPNSGSNFSKSPQLSIQFLNLKPLNLQFSNLRLTIPKFSIVHPTNPSSNNQWRLRPEILSFKSFTSKFSKLSHKPIKSNRLSHSSSSSHSILSLSNSSSMSSWTSRGIKWLIFRSLLCPYLLHKANCLNNLPSRPTRSGNSQWPSCSISQRSHLTIHKPMNNSSSNVKPLSLTHLPSKLKSSPSLSLKTQRWTITNPSSSRARSTTNTTKPSLTIWCRSIKISNHCPSLKPWWHKHSKSSQHLMKKKTTSLMLIS